MSPEAVTQRMEALNQLWELTVALQSSEIIKKKSNKKIKKNDRNEKK